MSWSADALFAAESFLLLSWELTLYYSFFCFCLLRVSLGKSRKGDVCGYAKQGWDAVGEDEFS